MWVFTQHGFYSVVAYDNSMDSGQERRKDDLLLVRARVREDLERTREWIPDLEIEQNDRADYKFRAVVSREAWKRVLTAEADALDYTNFKTRVAENADHVRHSAYMNVWSAVRRLQT